MSKNDLEINIKTNSQNAKKELDSVGKSAEKVEKNIEKIGKKSKEELGMGAEFAEKFGDKITDAGDGVQAMDQLMGQFGMSVSVLGTAIGSVSYLVEELKAYNAEMSKAIELQNQFSANRFLSGKSNMSQEAINSQAEGLMSGDADAQGLVGADRQKRIQEISNLFGVMDKVSKEDYQAISGISKSTGMGMEETAKMFQSKDIKQLSEMTGLKADESKMSEKDREKYIADAQYILRGKGLNLYGDVQSKYAQKKTNSFLGNLLTSNEEKAEADNYRDRVYENQTAWNKYVSQKNKSGYSSDFNAQETIKKQNEMMSKATQQNQQTLNGLRKTVNNFNIITK